VIRQPNYDAGEEKIKSGTAAGWMEIEIARLSPLAITQTSIIIKYSLIVLYAINTKGVTKKKPRRKRPEQ
jgi:hypothetical protein